MDSFSITLNCNSNTHSEQDGIHDFYTVFNENINLSGDWECALEEISFEPTKGDLQLYIITPYDIRKIPTEIVTDQYTYENLIEEMNEKTKSIYLPQDEYKIDPPKFLKTDKGLTLQSGYHSSGYMFFMVPSKALCEIFGVNYRYISTKIQDIFKKFPNEGSKQEKLEYFEKTKNIPHSYPIKMNASDSSIYICCDICKPIIHGEFMKPILRHFNFDQLDQSKTKRLKFLDPYYSRIIKQQFDNIHIQLFKYLAFSKNLNEKDELLNMKYGDIKISLHFRKIEDKQINYEK